MMVGIESVSFVSCGNAVDNSMSWSDNRIRQRLFSVTAGFKAVAVGSGNHILVVSVFNRPAMIEYYRRIAVNQIETIVTIPPCATSPEYVTCVFFRNMASETVTISAFPFFG